MQSVVQWSLRTTKEISAFVTTFAELIKEDKQPIIKSFLGISIYLGLSPCIFFDDYDIETLERCKIEPSTPCRNIYFIKKIKNNLKDYSRLSFYCASNIRDIKNYEEHWKYIFGHCLKNISFQEYKTSVPENCKYIANQSLYCPLIEMKKIFNYN